MPLFYYDNGVKRSFAFNKRLILILTNVCSRRHDKTYSLTGNPCQSVCVCVCVTFLTFRVCVVLPVDGLAASEIPYL